MFLAWKEMKHNKMRYSLIMIILVLLIFLVLFLAGLARGLSAATSSAIDNSSATYFILDDSADSLIPRSSISEDNFTKITDYISEVTPINLQRAAATRNVENTKLDITYFGIDPNGFLMPKLVEGNSLTGENQIVLNLSFKEEGFKIGDVVKDSGTGYEMTVVGFTKNQMYGHSSIGVIDMNSYISMQKASLGKDVILNQGLAINERLSEKEKTELKDYLEKNVTGAILLQKNEIISKIPGHSQEQSTILMMLGFLLVISSFIVGVFFYVTTMQKIPQFGVLKALGAKMSTLAGSLICQVFLITFFSMIVGNILTFGMASVLPANMPFVLKPMNAFIVSGLFIAISLLSSLISLSKVSKVDPITAIGGNE